MPQAKWYIPVNNSIIYPTTTTTTTTLCALYADVVGIHYGIDLFQRHLPIGTFLSTVCIIYSPPHCTKLQMVGINRCIHLSACKMPQLMSFLSTVGVIYYRYILDMVGVRCGIDLSNHAPHAKRHSPVNSVHYLLPFHPVPYPLC